MIRFTIVIPVYNIRPYLGECLESVRRSLASADDVAVEVVCVDDGSTDGSGTLLDEWASADCGPRFALKAIHQPNAGVGAARNRALDAATGEWLLFLDGDDLVRESWLSDVARVIRENEGVDLVGFGMLPHYGGEIKWGDDDFGIEPFSVGDEIPDALVGMSIYRLAYRRSRFGDIRFRSLSVGEDLVFTAEVFARATRCMVLSRREYLYRYREGSATHADVSTAKLRDTVAFHVEMFRVLESSGRRIGRAFVEGRGSMWIEELPKVLLPLRKTRDGRCVWEQWLDSMSFAAGLACLTESQRRRARKVAASRSAWSVLLNCRLPAWLRRKGFLR